MIFKQGEQIVGLKKPPKTQTRRPNFPYELAVQLWKYGWSYPRSPFQHWDESKQRWSAPPWKEWLSANPVTKADVAEANRILAEHVITLPVQPGRGKKAVGRTSPIKTIRRERLGDISEGDCLAEGIGVTVTWAFFGGSRGYRLFVCPICDQECVQAQDAYACLWNHCYGNGAWERMEDEDVFVLEFEPCDE